MIYLDDLSKAYGPQVLFSDLSWHIKPGQRVGLVGPNGAGKTTLFGVINGDVAADGGTARCSKGTTIGYLPQEIATLAGTTVRAEARRGLEEVIRVGEALRDLEGRLERAGAGVAQALMEQYGELQARFEAQDGFTAESRVEGVLAGLGFDAADFDRDCGTLSGGWAMRVALARLLLQAPDVLLLDEPTNHLDLESLLWLEGFFLSFRGSLVVISHDRTFLNRLCTHIAELAGGELHLYTGDFDAYLRQAEQQQSLEARQRANQQRKRAELQRFIDRFRAKATKARQVQSRVKRLEKMQTVGRGRRSRTIHFELPEPPRSGRVPLRLVDAHQAYGDQVIYRGLDLELLRGQKAALVGPNGAGKSTLLKILAGRVPLTGGRRELGERTRLYYFAQHQVDALALDRTVLQEASAGVEGAPPKRVRGVLGAFLFGEDAVDKRVGSLSGGEKNRLALAKMLMTPVNVLLLDEPTNHLDMASRAVLEAALAAYGGTLVLVSHDRHFMDSVVEEVWDVAGGRVTPYNGTYSEYAARIARGDRAKPLPLHSERPPRPAARRVAPAPIVAPEPSPAPTRKAIDWGAGGGTVKRRNRKDDRRQEAEARQRRAEATRGLRAAVAAAEAEVQALEARIEALRAAQADPAHYADPANVAAVAREVSSAGVSLAAAYGRWEKVAAELESVESGL